MLNSEACFGRNSCAAVSQKGLAPERGIVLEQVIDIPHPVVFLPWSSAFLWTLCTVGFGDRGSVDAWNGIRGRLNVDGFARVENVGCSAIHRDPCGGTAAVTYLKPRGEESGKVRRNY
jgi:hypothetical protein